MFRFLVNKEFFYRLPEIIQNDIFLLNMKIQNKYITSYLIKIELLTNNLIINKL